MKISSRLATVATPALPLRLIQAFLVTVLGYFVAQLLSYEYRNSLPESRIDIDQVYFSKGHARTAPEVGDYGDMLDLPFNWREGGHGADKDEGTGWYTAVIKLNVPPNRLWVVYFPNISANSTIYLNNEILGRGVNLNDRLGQMRQRPLYLNIPNGILHSDGNVLQIYMRSGNAFYGSIEPFFLGPEVDFKDVYSDQYFYEVTIVKVIGILMFFSAIGNGVIWLLRKQETLNGWFALGCLLWSFHILSHFHIKSSWLLSYLEYLFRYISITWFTAILVVIVNRYQQFQVPSKERGVFFMATAITILLPLVPGSYVHLVSNLLVGAFALSMIAYSYFSLLLNQTRRGSMSDFFIAMSIAIIFFLSVNDLMSTLSLSERKYSGMTAHYGAPFLVIVLSWKLIRDFVRARSDAEELNRTLEVRVEMKSRELEENFARMREMEERTVLARERDRLVMEMHDGLGGQLVSAMSMLDYDNVDRKVVSDTLQVALTDLRLMIDALDPVCDDLAMVLGSFRTTLEKTLVGSGIKLIWRVQDVPTVNGMNPHKVLQILRILQEAVTNAIKYSLASEITVATGSENDRVFLSVSDNGKGIDKGIDAANGLSHGRGLQNMRRRAQMIGADLHIQTENGVFLKLVLQSGSGDVPVATD